MSSSVASAGDLSSRIDASLLRFTFVSAFGWGLGI